MKAYKTPVHQMYIKIWLETDYKAILYFCYHFNENVIILNKLIFNLTNFFYQYQVHKKLLTISYNLDSRNLNLNKFIFNSF